jgi:hypothetical protein
MTVIMKIYGEIIIKQCKKYFFLNLHYLEINLRFFLLIYF